MIRVVFDGMTLTLQGHAGAAPHGQDLVCAAVSGLVYALAQRLTELDRQDAFSQPPVIRLSPGNARICVTPKGDYAGEVQAIFRLLQSGLRLLQQHYPAQIQLN